MQHASAEPAASLEGVSKSYGGQAVLANVHLEIARGAVTALLGPNGAGKSTVAGLITGRLAPDKGRARLFGLDPRKREARARQGVMLQSAGLPDGLTVAEAIDLHASYYRRRVRLQAVLEEAGLTELARRRCSRLSGGETRRVQFALAIAGAPDFLVLDEPTTGFDPEARRALWRIVRDKAAAGASILLATHHMDEAEALADRIVIIADGELIADGPPGAIRKRVAGTSIRCETSLRKDELARLPGVVRVLAPGASKEILTLEPRGTLEALFAADPNLADFEVRAASLEEALADIVEAHKKGKGS